MELGGIRIHGASQVVPFVSRSSSPLAAPSDQVERSAGRPTGKLFEAPFPASFSAHLKRELDAGVPVVVRGGAGSGKVSVLKAAEPGSKRFASTPDLDLGSFQVKGSGFAWQDAPLATALSRPGPVILEEPGLLEPTLQKQLATLVMTGELPLEGRPESLRLHADCRLMVSLFPGQRLEDELAAALGVAQRPEALERRFEQASKLACLARVEGKPLPLSPEDCQRAQTFRPTPEDQATVREDALGQIPDDRPVSLNLALGADPSFVEDQVRQLRESASWLEALERNTPSPRQALWRLAQTAPEQGETFTLLLGLHQGEVEPSVESLQRINSEVEKGRSHQDAVGQELRRISGVPQHSPSSGGVLLGQRGISVGGTFLRTRTRSG